MAQIGNPKLHRIWFTLLACLLFSLLPAGAQEELARLRAAFEKLEASAGSAQTQLDTRYEQELEKLKKEASVSGNINFALAVRSELKDFRERKGVTKEFSEHPGLAKLQNIYAAQSAKVAEQRAANSLRNRERFRKELAALGAKLKGAGDAEAALEVFVELEQVEKLIAEAKAGAAPAAGEKSGRFLRFELSGDVRILSLTEVEVMSGGKNVAPGGRATQSSTYSKNAELPSADKAIDGDTDGNFFKAKSTTHTEREEDPWWELDLKKPVAVSRIIVWNREEENVRGRLDGCRITLLDGDRKVIWEAKIEDASERSLTFQIGE